MTKLNKRSKANVFHANVKECKLIIPPKCSFVFLLYFQCLFLKPLNIFHPFVLNISALEDIWIEFDLRSTSFETMKIYIKYVLEPWSPKHNQIIDNP